MNSDTAATFILAKEMHLRNSISPREYFYANGDYPLGVNSIFYILAKFIEPTLELMRISNVIMGSILIYSLYFCVKRVTSNRQISLISCGLFATGFSPSINFFLFGQGSYASYIACLLFFFGSTFFTLDSNGKTSLLQNSLAWIPLGVLYFQNPIRALAWAFIPFILLTLYHFYTSNNETRLNTWAYLELFRNYLITGLIIITFFVILRLHFDSNNKYSTGIGDSDYTPAGSRFEGLGNLYNSTLYTLGISANQNTNLFGLESFVSFARIMFITIFLGFIWITKSNLEVSNKSIILAGLVTFSISAYLLANTEYFANIESGRYLIPGFLVILVGLMGAIRINDSSNQLNKLLLFSLLILISLNTLQNFKTLNGVKNPHQELLLKKPFPENSQVLATFWNSNVLEVLSNDEIRAISVMFDSDECLVPYYWGTTISHFENINSEVYVLLDSFEFNEIKANSSCNSIFRNSNFKIEYEPYIIIKIGTDSFSSFRLMSRG